MAPAHRFVYRLPSLFRIYSERMCAIMKISEGRALSELCNPIRLVFTNSTYPFEDGCPEEYRFGTWK